MNIFMKKYQKMNKNKKIHGIFSNFLLIFYVF